MRRVLKRMQAVGVADFGNYLDYLEVHPEEFVQLFNTILINVTSFFRDPQAWQHLASEILPRILAGKKPGDPMRVWSAGCASGEEAYTLAMVLIQTLGMEGFREHAKVYATDVDEEALALARQGGYSPKDIQPIPAELRDQCFELTGNPLHVPPRPASRGHLRPSRPDAGRSHLPPGPAGLSQHRDVFQRRSPG